MLPILLAASLGVPADPPKELPAAARAELKTLEGKWRVVRFLHADRETTEAGVVVEFKGGRIDFAGVGAGEVLEVDPATDPKCLDFKVVKESGALRKGMTYESVYKLDGDRLTWAIHTGREKNRPAGFGKPSLAGTMVIVLERVKE